MIYQNISRKYFAWLYKHVGTFKKDILICSVLSILALMSSLLFVEVQNLYGCCRKGQRLFFCAVGIFANDNQGLQHILRGLKIYLREKQTFFMSNELSLKFFKELFTVGVSYDEKVHSGDSLSKLTTDVFSVSSCMIGTIPELLYAFISLIATCVYLGSLAPSLTLIILMIMSVNILFGRSYAKKLLPLSREIRI